jgi:uncharacterized protein (DUF58 family)
MTPASERDLRIATLVLAPLVAAVGAVIGSDELVMYPAAPALIAIWMVMIATLIVRARIEARRPDARVGVGWDQLDVLTATGSSVMWGSAVALVLAGGTGWASLGVIGVLGLATSHVAVIWTALLGGGDAPWRRATITREILPAQCTEGDPLREELTLRGVWIPPGMRLFASGRALPHGRTTRYAVDARDSRAELRLERALGPAPRGEHDAPALSLWLRDVLGLTRTPVVFHGEARFTVLPKPAAVRGARALLGPGGDDALAVPAQRQPTEGTFRIRAYAPGDDTRRIHWIRSLQADALVVRLPDEIPPADPVVRLILDNELRGTEALSCYAPHALLDALVQVWLGTARELAEAGTRVVLVAAAEHAGALAIVERAMQPRAPRDSLRLGGKVRWQAELPLDQLIGRGEARQLVVSSRPRAVAGDVGWIVVPEVAWTRPEVAPPPRSKTVLPFPLGSADNRRRRRRDERMRVESIGQDRAVFSQLMCWTDLAAFAGHHVARPSADGVQLEVIP